MGSDTEMLKLQNIRKVYALGDEKIEALKDLSIRFRKNEFVSVLGPSGCGKTTLLNIIGGLDQYTSGDLVISGRSTKKYTDRDWDTYRNHSVGFVFQSYNLIPHQSVLANVELALTISGVSRAERRQRAAEALRRVGLGDQLSKKPNQMSGGQMQRVAIARALVNDPEILLADEPTGALDSTTSIQIMDLLREIAKDRLVVMVTHNPELAEQYSTRIVKLLDGKLVSDSNPYAGEEPRAGETPEAFAARKEKERLDREKGKKRASMSFMTALSLSLKNLMTKKTRTFLTSFAGSIGIIGIALILSVSQGVNNFINAVQRDTLSSYPINIVAEEADFSGLMTTLMGEENAANGGVKHELDRVYANSVLYEMMNSINSIEVEKNNLKKFREFLETDEEIQKYISAIHYDFGADMTFYTTDTDGKIIRADLAALLEGSGMTEAMGGSMSSSQNPFMSGFSQIGVVEEMLPGDDGALVGDLLLEQYDLIYGRWPTAKEEIVLIVNENNEISDLSLYALGLKSSKEFNEAITAYFRGEEIEATGGESWSYEEICAHTYKLVLNDDRYVKVGNTYFDRTATDEGIAFAYDAGLDIRVSGIIRKNPDAVAGMLSGSIGYTAALTEHLIAETANSQVVKDQLASPDIDVLTGLPFETEENTPTYEKKLTLVEEYVAGLSVAEKAALYRRIATTPTDAEVDRFIDAQTAGKTRAELLEEYKGMIDAYAGNVGLSPEEAYEYFLTSDDATFRSLLRVPVAAMMAQEIEKALSMMQDGQLAGALMMAMADETTGNAYKIRIYEEFMPSAFSPSSYSERLSEIGYVDGSSPAGIKIFAKSFEDKDAISRCITRYNESVTDQEDEISYTDYVALLMSSVTVIVNAISYVLIAFVAISLVVSSIMIGIITYISVLERTKEIGILRAIGASKRDISRVFNAETLIVGFTAGAIGIIFTLLFIIPINLIIHALTGLGNLSATLPPLAALILVAISMVLTLISGLVPAKMAARKDPVIALRSE